jgi:FtsH-binding integral membrane protein
MDNVETKHGSSHEHHRYARVLEIGVLLGLVVLAVGFLLYVFGLIPAHVPASLEPNYWSLPVQEYLAQTHTPAGWKWVSMIGQSDELDLAGVAILAGVTGLSFLSLIPVYLARRDTPYVVITALNIGILVLAASGTIR